MCWQRTVLFFRQTLIGKQINSRTNENPGAFEIHKKKRQLRKRWETKTGNVRKTKVAVGLACFRYLWRSHVVLVRCFFIVFIVCRWLRYTGRSVSNPVALIT